ncbi:hypothetical protein NicSoilE8_17690 [Arthrobacter sp. NicSoilE8]|nr:hypothetical protein NicSoilE8_17690 [Arthrobacter sp. NicSoilE8]
MSVVETLAQTLVGQRQLRLVEALTELEPLDNHQQVGVSPLRAESEKWGLESGAITSDLKYLQSIGLVQCFESVAGINNVFIKQPGLDAAGEFKQLKCDLRKRVQEIRDAVLNWLYDLYLQDVQAASTNAFVASDRGNFFGEPYTQSELDRAVRWLRSEEYIKGVAVYGDELLRPVLTPKAIRTIETGNSVNALLTSAGVNVTEVHVQGSSGVNIAVASSNVNQSNTLTQGQIEQVEKMLGSVRALLNPHILGVTDEVIADAQRVVGEIEAETRTSTPETRKVKALALKLMELAATGTVQGAIDAINTVVQQGITGM